MMGQKMNEIDEIAVQIDALRDELNSLRPLPSSVLEAIRKPRDLELTYSSNAIEGNTLTLRETSEVIVHGITISNKPLRDHLEAIDHHDALRFMYELAARDQNLTAMDVRQLHKLVIQRSKADIAGQYAIAERTIAGSSLVLPPVAEIKPLMTEFGDWLQRVGSTPKEAFEAHYRLVSIHPFQDGNGRTSRLLMNLLLVKGGYQPVPVRPEDRTEYLKALEHSDAQRNTDRFQLFMHRQLLGTMQSYTRIVREAVRNLENSEQESEQSEDHQHRMTAEEIARFRSQQGPSI